MPKNTNPTASKPRDRAKGAANNALAATPIKSKTRTDPVDSATQSTRTP
jgi:hypothetical protein